jgi:uncharacterized HAD superfamily protein
MTISDPYIPKSKVAFDIDGIVLDTATEIWERVTSELGIKKPIEEWTKYSIEETLGIDIKELRPIYEPVLKRTDIPLLYFAKEALQWFFGHTNEPLLFITARRPQFVGSAKRSIENALGDIPIEVVTCSVNQNPLEDIMGNSKVGLLKRHGIKFFVEDNPKYWKDYMDSGINIGTLDLPWTHDAAENMLRGLVSLEENFEKFIRFHGWVHLEAYLVIKMTGALGFRGF